MICLFAGVHLTADSISREKRDGTLGLLFLTPLTPFQIVIGKMVAHGLMGFYAVFIGVPLLCLVLIAGGVRFLQIFELALWALNILFFSCAVGLWASARHTERKKAAASGTWVVVLFWWGIPLIVQLLNHYRSPAWLIELVGLFAVNGSFNSIFAGPRMRLVQAPWFNFLVTHLMAWTFLGFAIYFLKHRWQDAPAKEKFRLREWWKKKSYGSPEVRRRIRDQLLDRNPFFWLASRDRWRSLNAWTFTIIFLGFMAWQFRRGLAGLEPACFMLLVVAFTHKVLTAGFSAHQLSIEHEQGTLEMLLSTPLKTETVLKGQLMAVTRQVRGPILLWFVAQSALLLLMFLWRSTGGPEAMLLIVGFTIYMFIHLFELYVMAWAGMWGAVTVKEAKNAAGSAMARIIMIPALTFGLVMSAGGFLTWYFQLNWNVPAPLIVGFYFTLAISNAIGWLIYFRKNLPLRLREFAMKRYTPDPNTSVWGKLGQLFGRFRAGQRTAPVLKESNV
ncbi:MAG TPA: ABC transporter permease subunit [Verrucomicrobiae bacterium]